MGYDETRVEPVVEDEVRVVTEQLKPKFQFDSNHPEQLEGVKIFVQPLHIEVGISRDAGHCPIAVALREQIGMERVLVSNIILIDGSFEYEISAIATDWIVSFDTGRGMSPFSFRIGKYKGGGRRFAG